MSYEQINNVVFALGRLDPSGVRMLGTMFLLPISNTSECFFASAAHTVGYDHQNLVLVLKPMQTTLEYQDTSDHSVQTIPLTVHTTDPFHDLIIFKAERSARSNMVIGSADDVAPGDDLVIFGFPHADQGRMVLTQQRTEVGARILIDTGGLKGKHLVLNIQSRPGQSGSPIFRRTDTKLVAILIGSYAPNGGGGISLGGVDPHTLHQTTHAVSAEYLRDMVSA